MNTLELLYCVHKDVKIKNKILGVFALDKLPHIVNQFPACLICNLQSAYLPGNHWIAIYLPVGENNAIYFDPLGQKIQNKEFITFLKNNNIETWDYNDKVLQSVHSDACGQFCVFFLYMLCRGKSLLAVQKYFIAGDRKLRNTALVKKWFCQTFGSVKCKLLNGVGECKVQKCCPLSEKSHY